MRYKITFSYEGTNFLGYQRQPGEGRTVQGEIEEALRILYKEEVEIHASGRTDKGVHARGQVAHFDLNLCLEPDKICYAVNRFLGRDIRLHQEEIVDEAFHARKSALGKHYSYKMYFGKKPPAIGYATFCPIFTTFSPEIFFLSLLPLLGGHNFQGFCGRGSSVKTYERTIYAIALEVEGDWLPLHLVGDGFLRKMIRNIVGTALDMIFNRRQKEALLTCLTERDRTKGGQTAPSEGLVLEEVFYTKADLLAKMKSLETLTYYQGEDSRLS